MPRAKKLTKRQLAVLDGLFKADSKLDEQATLKKCRVPRPMYERWLADKRFADELQQRIVRAHRESRILLARKASWAAKRLVDLANAPTGETTRKACLDIIALNRPPSHNASPEAQPPSKDSTPAPELSTETASRLLATLAEETQPQR